MYIQEGGVLFELNIIIYKAVYNCKTMALLASLISMLQHVPDFFFGGEVPAAI